MKLSKVIKSIENGTLEVDIDENTDVVFWIQDATDVKNAKIFGTTQGNNSRIASMLAFLMTKNERLLEIIKDASSCYLKKQINKTVS